MKYSPGDIIYIRGLYGLMLSNKDCAYYKIYWLSYNCVGYTENSCIDNEATTIVKKHD
jgi:hypothetical protein